jgi:hypothetical protein
MKHFHYGIAWCALIAAICFCSLNNHDGWAIFFAFMLIISVPPKDNDNDHPT